MDLQEAYSGQSLSGNGPIPVPQDTLQQKLHHLFHYTLLPAVQQSLFSAQFEGERRYVWATLIATGQHSLLHVAPNMVTSEAYNCVETDQENPMLVYGSQQLWPKSLVEEMIRAHPPEHAAVPPQIAFVLTPIEAQAPSPTCESLQRLIKGEIPLLSTNGYNIELMTPPSGRESLSFKKTGFPIEFWTHDRRGEVLEAAIQRTQDLVQQYQPEEAGGIQRILDILKRVKQQEDTVGNLATDIKGKDEKIGKLTRQVKRLEGLKQENARNGPAVQSMNEAIDRAMRERQQLRSQCDQDGHQLQRERDELVRLRQMHERDLPRSYLSPTFQMAVDFTDPQGRHIYKRFAAGGRILTEVDKPASEIRFDNAVHLGYHLAKLPDPI